MITECRYCGEPVTRRAETGRPPVYCGTACRRSAGFEVGRINGHLGRLETELSGWRMSPPEQATVYGCTATERCAILAEEINRQQVRLRALLHD